MRALPAVLGLIPAVAFAGFRGGRSGWERPLLDGPVASVASEDGRFRIHWSTAGPGAPRGADGDGDGVPDVVDEVFDALEVGRLAFEARGYRPVAPDDGTGGDDALDVYLRPLDANGYATPLPGAAPDGGAACFIELDTRLSGPILGSVAQHELHHCIQYRYTVAADPWIYEATATWEQVRLAPEGLDVALQVLYATRLGEPERPLASRGGRYEYAGFLVLKHLEEFRRPAPRAPALWEALADDPDWERAFEAVTGEAFGLSLDAWFVWHGVWNAFACGRDDGAHYAPEPAGCTSPASVPVEAIDVDVPFAVRLPETRWTAAYFSIDAAGDDRPVAVTCSDAGEAEWSLALVPVDRAGVGGRVVRSGPTGGRLEVRLPDRVDRSGEIVLVAASVGEEPLDVRCTATRVAPLFDEAVGCTAVAPGGGAWIAAITGVVWRRRRVRGRPAGPGRTPGRGRPQG